MTLLASGNAAGIGRKQTPVMVSVLRAPSPTSTIRSVFFRMTPSPTLHSITVRRTARVATLGNPATSPVWWVVLHGYGQRAPDFIQEFEPIAKANRCVVAPEGLSRFYLDGMETHEEVGASWMTRDDRSNEIDDYVGYLDAVVRRLGSNTNPRCVRVLGFSQGAATASRWALLGTTSVEGLVLWGGGPAHDLDLEDHAALLRRMNLTLVLGTDDPYISTERLDAMRSRLAQCDIPVTVQTFEGGHRLDTGLLTTLVESTD